MHVQDGREGVWSEGEVVRPPSRWLGGLETKGRRLLQALPFAEEMYIATFS